MTVPSFLVRLHRLPSGSPGPQAEWVRLIDDHLTAVVGYTGLMRDRPSVERQANVPAHWRGYGSSYHK